MAEKSVYIPFYADGAWHWIKLIGEVDPKGVPEGRPAIKSSACTTTPARRLQPHN